MAVYESEMEKVRKDMQELAKQFGLGYKEELYRSSFLTKKEAVILNFLTGCPVSLYAKFGRTARERVKRLDEFTGSREFSKLSKLQGGCVASKRLFQRSIGKIRNGKVRARCNKIMEKLEPSLPKETVIVVTIPESKREKMFAFDTILFHEWIHVLLMSNGLFFQKMRHEYWKLDEGLTTYIQTYFEKKTPDISETIRQRINRSGKNSFYRTVYAKNALKFNALLKNKASPADRRYVIINYYRKLKKHAVGQGVRVV